MGPCGMRQNLVTRLRRRGRANPMAAHDRLPPRARVWVTQAALPWSAASVSRIWARALRETGSEEAAIARLDLAEARMLARDGVVADLHRMTKEEGLAARVF